MRSIVTSVCEVVGMAVVSVGVGVWFGVGPALVAAGAALVGVGIAGGRS